MKTETFDDKEAFLAAVQGKPRTTRGRGTRPDLPSAGRAAPTGLTTLLLAGWNWEYRASLGYRAYRGALDSGWWANEKSACDAAKELL